MIIKIDKDTVIPEGKFVCPDSMLTDGICGYPRRVTKVAGQRIYYVPAQDAEAEALYMTRQRAAYLCDTFEEGKAICDLGLARVKAVNKSRELVYAEYAVKLSALLKGTTHEHQ